MVDERPNSAEEGFFFDERKIDGDFFRKEASEAPAGISMLGRGLGHHLFRTDEGMSSFIRNHPDLHELFLKSKERENRLRAAARKDRRRLGVIRQRATECMNHIGSIMAELQDFMQDDEDFIEFAQTFVSPKVGTYRFYATTNYSGELWSLVVPGVLHIPVPAIAGSDDNNMGSLSIFKPAAPTAVTLYDGTCYTGTKRTFGSYPDSFTRSFNLAEYGFNNRVSSFWFLF